MLQSPIISPVHQIPDARGFPYTVEFQRLAMNLNHQTYDAYAGGFINLDSDIDTDDRNCLLCQVFYPRFGGVYYQVGRFNTYPVRGGSGGPWVRRSRRTFGPLTDPDGSVAGSGIVTGDETGFTGFTLEHEPEQHEPDPDSTAPDMLAVPRVPE